MEGSNDQTVLDGGGYFGRRFDDVYRQPTVVASETFCGKRWEDMMQKSFSYALMGAVALAISMIFLLGLTYAYWAIFPAVVYGPTTGEFRPPVVVAGSSTLLCRDLTFPSDIDYTVSRHLVSSPAHGEVQILIDLGSSTTSRQKGFVRQCRLQHIPYGTPPGDWTMRAQITYRAWPFWDFTEEAPSVPLRVI